MLYLYYNSKWKKNTGRNIPRVAYSRRYSLYLHNTALQYRQEGTLRYRVCLRGIKYEKLKLKYVDSADGKKK